MKNFGTVIDNFDAVTKQYVDNKVPTDEHIKGIKVDNATLADTAKKVQNAFTYKAHNKAKGTTVPITYDGSEAARLDFSADDFAYDYNLVNDITVKLAEDVKTSLGKADTALQSAPVTSVNGKTGDVTLGAGDVGALPSSTKFVSSVNGQSGAVTGLATTSEVNAKYTKPSDGIPKSDLASSVQTSLGKADTALQSAPVTSVNGKTGDVTGLATKDEVNAKQNALTETQLAAVDSGITEAKRTKYDGYEEIINQKANSADLATVATSGNYNDLLNKPTIPTDYVPNTRKVNNKALSSDITLGASDVGALPTAGGTVTGNLTVGGNLTVNGTTTTVDSTTLQVKDKLIEVAHGNTEKLTSPAGIVAPKYDGTNSGALVFNGDGIASVGDVVLDASGNIDVTQSNLQPLATRTGLVNDNLVKYDGTNQTLVDTGKKISDFATVAQVNAKYTKPESGIPKSDLAIGVQASLDKADNAVQSFEAEATIDDTTGTPTVEVVKSGESTAPTYTFNFKHLKGTDGQQGEAGLVYLGISTSEITATTYDNSPISDFSRTPKIGETYIMFSNKNQYALMQVVAVRDGRVESIVYNHAKLYIVSTKGQDGVSVTNAIAGTSTVADGKTTTPITFSLSDGTTKEINVEAQNGTDGAQGIGVKSITSGTPTVVNDKTNTPITITLTDNTTVDLVVSAENGKDGTSATVDIVQSIGQSTTAVMSQKAVTDELNKKANTSDIPTKYVVSVNGESGEVKNIAKTNSANTFTGDQTVTGNGSVSGNFTVGGNLTVNGTTTTVDSTTLQVKDKLIEVAHGNTTTLTTPAGLVAPKYDGTNSGALVFDSTGTAYVGDVTLKDGNIDVANSGLQPLATRTGLVGGNLVQYDSSAQTLKDSGKKISDLALKTDISGKLSKTENTGVNVLGTTKATTTLGGNQLVAPNGIIFAGTAANAGLVTRGICGVSTPDSNGACSKENLYINYDGNNDFNAGRQVVLNAGAVGNHLGSNMYQYAVPRGDIVKAWVESKGYATTSQVEARYEKPTNGIPKTDLESAVQTSLGKADSALQAKDISGKANLAGGNTFSGVQTINAPTDVSGSEQTTMKVKTSNGGAIIFGKQGANSGTMIRLDQADGTCRLRFRSSATAGAMVWEQPEQGAHLYVDLGKDGSDKHRVTFPSSAGTLALTSQIPTVNNGTLTIQKNGTNVATFSANQSTNSTANITVPVKVSELTNDSGYTTNKGTVTQVKINGATKSPDSAGLVDLGTGFAKTADLPIKSASLSGTTLYLTL